MQWEGQAGKVGGRAVGVPARPAALPGPRLQWHGPAGPRALPGRLGAPPPAVGGRRDAGTGVGTYPPPRALLHPPWVPSASPMPGRKKDASRTAQQSHSIGCRQGLTGCARAATGGLVSSGAGLGRSALASGSRMSRRKPAKARESLFAATTLSPSEVACAQCGRSARIPFNACDPTVGLGTGARQTMCQLRRPPAREIMNPPQNRKLSRPPEAAPWKVHGARGRGQSA